MSLTTVAAPVQPDETLIHLSPSRPERFQRSISSPPAWSFSSPGRLYRHARAKRDAPDSGELITAAAKFGVGHPPGYPLWTMSGLFCFRISCRSAASPGG